MKILKFVTFFKVLMACWKRLHLQFRPRWTSGRTSKSSNGRKIARMARNSTIFGPNESSRRHLFLEKNSKSRNNRKVFEKLRKIFEKFVEKFFERCNLMGDVILSNASLTKVCSKRFLLFFWLLSISSANSKTRKFGWAQHSQCDSKQVRDKCAFNDPLS